jgi:hypothetical protein
MIGPIKTAIKVGELGKSYSSLTDFLQYKVPGIRVEIPANIMRPKTIIMHNKGVKLALNGREVDMEMIESIPPTNIEYIEKLYNGGAIFENAPVLNFVTKSNASNYETVGISRLKCAGFYMAREFYSPRYDIPSERHSVADKRTTLYWEPMVETDSLGRAAVSFFSADAASRYRIVMEGITPDGCPGTTTMTFVVK